MTAPPSGGSTPPRLPLCIRHVDSYTVPMPELRWLDGPSFVKWAVQERPRLVHSPNSPSSLAGRFNATLIGESTARSVHRWQRGGLVDSHLNAFERFMDSLNLHHWEIPDDCYRANSLRPRLTADQKHQIVQLMCDGLNASEVASIVGCARKTVEYWWARS